MEESGRVICSDISMVRFRNMIRKALRPSVDVTQYEVIEIPIRSCVHFTGFRYGIDGFHPYENSARDLRQGVPLLKVRRRFVEFLQYYQPRHLGEALGISLSRHYALWGYPWRRLSESERSLTYAWHDKPEEVSDIITHFSEAGIHSYRIDQEFFWQERALQILANNGYRPDLYSYIQTLELRRRDGSSAYIVTDGNHRVSALAALGHQSVVVQHHPSQVVDESQLENWPEVQCGRMDPDDAQATFDAYFQRNSLWRTTPQAVEIIGPADWKKLYLKERAPESQSRQTQVQSFDNQQSNNL